MKTILLIIALFVSLNSMGQVKSASLQASGLTCSMCSNAIYKALKTLDFVEKVDANIKTSTFTISFKSGGKVDFDKLKAKVEGAGFFVANLTAWVHFDKVSVTNDSHIILGGTTFHFINVKSQTITGDKTIRILDKGFVSAKEYKSNSRFTSMECYKTGVVGSCCTKDGLVKGTRIFHVTI